MFSLKKKSETHFTLELSQEQINASRIMQCVYKFIVFKRNTISLRYLHSTILGIEITLKMEKFKITKKNFVLYLYIM